MSMTVLFENTYSLYKPIHGCSTKIYPDVVLANNLSILCSPLKNWMAKNVKILATQLLNPG